MAMILTYCPSLKIRGRTNSDHHCTIIIITPVKTTQQYTASPSPPDRKKSPDYPQQSELGFDTLSRLLPQTDAPTPTFPLPSAPPIPSTFQQLSFAFSAASSISRPLSDTRPPTASFFFLPFLVFFSKPTMGITANQQISSPENPGELWWKYRCRIVSIVLRIFVFAWSSSPRNPAIAEAKVAPIPVQVLIPIPCGRRISCSTGLSRDRFAGG